MRLISVYILLLFMMPTVTKGDYPFYAENSMWGNRKDASKAYYDRMAKHEEMYKRGAYSKKAWEVMKLRIGFWKIMEEKNYPEFEKMLKKHYKKGSPFYTSHRTPGLMLKAIMLKNWKLYELLLKYGGPKGRIPLYYAVLYDWIELFEKEYPKKASMEVCGTVLPIQKDSVEKKKRFFKVIFHNENCKPFYHYYEQVYPTPTYTERVSLNRQMMKDLKDGIILRRYQGPGLVDKIKKAKREIYNRNADVGLWGNFLNDEEVIGALIESSSRDQLKNLMKLNFDFKMWNGWKDKDTVEDFLANNKIHIDKTNARFHHRMEDLLNNGKITHENLFWNILHKRDFDYCVRGRLKVPLIYYFALMKNTRAVKNMIKLGAKYEKQTLKYFQNMKNPKTEKKISFRRPYIGDINIPFSKKEYQEMKKMAGESSLCSKSNLDRALMNLDIEDQRASYVFKGHHTKLPRVVDFDNNDRLIYDKKGKRYKYTRVEKKEKWEQLLVSNQQFLGDKVRSDLKKYSKNHECENLSGVYPLKNGYFLIGCFSLFFTKDFKKLEKVTPVPQNTLAIIENGELTLVSNGNMNVDEYKNITFDQKILKRFGVRLYIEESHKILQEKVGNRLLDTDAGRHVLGFFEDKYVLEAKYYNGKMFDSRHGWQDSGEVEKFELWLLDIIEGQKWRLKPSKGVKPSVVLVKSGPYLISDDQILKIDYKGKTVSPVNLPNLSGKSSSGSMVTVLKSLIFIVNHGNLQVYENDSGVLNQIWTQTI